MISSHLDQVRTLHVACKRTHYSTIRSANRAWKQASQATSSFRSLVRRFSKLILSDLFNSTDFNRCIMSTDRKWPVLMKTTSRPSKPCTQSSWMRSLSAHTYRRSIAPSSCASRATTSAATRRWRTCASTRTSLTTPKENVRIAT